MVVVVFGPKGCGKTRNAAAIAKAYGCSTVHDQEVPPTAAALRQAGGSHLVLALDGDAEQLMHCYMRVPGGVRIVPYATAAKRAGVA
jgi:hypothetical protein